MPTPDAVTLGAYNAYANRCLDANGDLIDDTVQITDAKKGLPVAECVMPLSSIESPSTEGSNVLRGALLAFVAFAVLASAATTAYVV